MSVTPDPAHYPNAARICADCGKPFVPTSGPIKRVTNWCDGCRENGRVAVAELRADADLIADVQAKITRQLRKDRTIAADRHQQAPRRPAQRI